MLALEKQKNQFDAREQDWPVQKFGLRRLQRFDAIQTEPAFIFLTQEDKRRLCSQDALKDANSEH